MKNDVSLWLGNFQNFDELEKYTEVKYDEDGDSILQLLKRNLN